MIYQLYQCLPSDLIGSLNPGNELLLIVKTKHILNPTGANGIIIRYDMAITKGLEPTKFNNLIC